MNQAALIADARRADRDARRVLSLYDGDVVRRVLRDGFGPLAIHEAAHAAIRRAYDPARLQRTASEAIRSAYDPLRMQRMASDAVRGAFAQTPRITFDAIHRMYGPAVLQRAMAEATRAAYGDLVQRAVSDVRRAALEPGLARWAVVGISVAASTVAADVTTDADAISGDGSALTDDVTDAVIVLFAALGIGCFLVLAVHDREALYMVAAWLTIGQVLVAAARHGVKLLP